MAFLHNKIFMIGFKKKCIRLGLIFKEQTKQEILCPFAKRLSHIRSRAGWT